MNYKQKDLNYIFFSSENLAVHLFVPMGKSITCRYFRDVILKGSRNTSINDVLFQDYGKFVYFIRMLHHMHSS